MTDFKDKYWVRRSGIYLQPTVLEPPANQNVNNARQAIWHMGRRFTIEVYPTSQPWQADGRHDRGEPRLVNVYGTIQPFRDKGGSSELISRRFGERSEGRIVVYIDSHQEENILVAEQNSDIFPNGIRVLGPDDEGTDDRFNFATVIRYRNRRWKPVETMEMFESGDEDLNDDGFVYRCICSELRDRSHERNATSEVARNNNETFWGNY